ncbi:hypothetical protein ANO14919_010590 [Xylariales sp. No.14919]|nr:hypothetical protein ANO14919_010590 [Xylariales sp. No.14919]
MESLRQEFLNATLNAAKPIILAVTLYNSSAEHDDLSAVPQLARMFPLILHVDAFRSFDRITCFSSIGSQRPGGKLRLTARNFKQPPPEDDDQSILASTIVAGGLDYSRHDSAIALKPASLGEKPTRVSVIRAFDSTLSGSRDAIPPLWLALYERRLGDCGLRHAFQYLESLRSHVLRMLDYHNISAIASPYSTDIIVRSCTRVQKRKLLGLGGSTTTKGNIILSINPYFSAMRVYSLLHAQLPFGSENRINEQAPHYQDFASLYPIPSCILNEIRLKVESWQIATRSIVGFPLHMGSLAALGPVIGLFWDRNIPKDWIERKSSEILSSRMKAFGLASPKSRKQFKGMFTNGSTMGNRCGIMTALEHFPHAFIYFSTEAHYSVIKTLRDCDTLREGSRYSQIRCSSDGSILVEALVQKAMADRKRCIDSGIEYQMILFANMGTTFTGAKDDLVGIYQKLSNAGIQISYIHVDGALDFGFEAGGIELGPCGALSNDGRPLVQGVTMSHHKALGSTVSGEVLCFSPENQLSSSLSSLVPQTVFEIWLCNRVYGPTDMSLMLNTCRENASHLETGLRGIRVATKRNDNGIITVLERPPAWVIEEFSLRPEGNWVHFITMPSVSRETVDRFVGQLSYIENQFSFAFSYTLPLLSGVLERSIKLQRVQCCSTLSERVLKLTQSLVTLDGTCGPDVDSAVNVKLRLRGAVSVVAVDEQDEIQVVFLAGSNRDQSIHKAVRMARRDRTAMSRTNVLETTEGVITISERWPRRDRNRGPPDLPDNFRTSTRVERCLEALNVLQSHRTQYLFESTLGVPLQFLHDSLPYMVQHDVNIIRPLEQDLWTAPLDLDEVQQELREFQGEYKESLPTRRYHFWPIDISDRLEEGSEARASPIWALIVLRLSSRNPEVDEPDDLDDVSPAAPYSFLDSYAVIDPSHGNASRDLEDDIAGILLEILPQLNIAVGPWVIREDPWVPPSMYSIAFLAAQLPTALSPLANHYVIRN